MIDAKAKELGRMLGQSDQYKALKRANDGLGADPDAQLIFDGLYRYVSSHGVAAQPSLMAWAQDAACHTAPGATTATDADLDIAYARSLIAIHRALPVAAANALRWPGITSDVRVPS